METCDFLLVEILLARDHLLDFILLLIELSQHLLALILQYQITSILTLNNEVIVTFAHAQAFWCIHLLLAGAVALRSRGDLPQGSHYPRCYGKTLFIFLNELNYFQNIQ
jgi:hypothetical protein